jgi:hypothetical protein
LEDPFSVTTPEGEVVERDGIDELNEALGKLREELQEYYGALEGLKIGFQTAIPDKPDALILCDQIKEMGIPLVAGGLMDQPYIWLLEYRICMEEKEIYNSTPALQK